MKHEGTRRDTNQKSNSLRVPSCSFVVLLLVALAATLARAEPESRSVREFGAKGDAATDDTAAFQAALDDAGKIGGRVFVPPGRYMLRGRLNVPDSVTLFGSFSAPARTQYNTGK